MPSANAHHSSPLPLEELKAWISSDTTYEWLQEGDHKAAAFQAELDANGTDQISNLFAQQDSDSDSDNGDGDGDDDGQNSQASDADFEGYIGRVRVWTSSATNINGIGSKYTGPQLRLHLDTKTMDRSVFEEETKIFDDDDDTAIRIVYAISESWEGYGDMLWASSRHLANQFAHPSFCRVLLQPLLDWKAMQPPSSPPDQAQQNLLQQQSHHPLHGLRVLELGAGCGVPSLVAMKCGAHVVCTDLDSPNRIRCIAESMQRNWIEMEQDHPTNTNAKDESRDNAHQTYPHAGSTRACPFRWGRDPTPVSKALTAVANSDNDDGLEGSVLLFDVICATDCLFMPWLHYELLDALTALLAEGGVAIMAFCIHEAFSKDHEVWPFTEKGTERGFHVEILDAVQLTPPRKGMDAKQGLVNMLRLTKAGK